jgi:hypothetical protein
MWLSKPVYEALPSYYVALGAIALLARLYVDYWYWPVICLVVGVGSVAAGVFVWIKRRNHRSRSVNPASGTDL